MRIATPSLPIEDVEKFVERNAGNWGARRDLITRVKFALQQALEGVIEHWDRKHPIALLLTYDEFDIEAKLTYSGERLELLAAPPAVDQILEVGGHLKLAGFLVRRQADKADSTVSDGICSLTLHFRQ